jgi:3D (Asp-Asp-Asp) domain-containing protein
MKYFVATIGLVLLLAPFASAREQAPAASQQAPVVRLQSSVPRQQTSIPRQQSAAAREQSLLARVTVYWARGGAGSDRYTRQHKTSTGLRLRDGHCAVDPRKIPYGSQVVFPDRTTLLAVDTGTAVKNRKAARRAGRTLNERSALVVDRFFETKGQALAWARRNPAFIALRVVPPNYRVQSTTRPVQPIAQPMKLASNMPPVANTSKAAANGVVHPISAMRMQ